MIPKISFVLLAYRQKECVAAAVRGALAQTGEPIEVVLSDDCSPDGTFSAMQAAVADYTGPHHVIVRKTAENMGLVRHLEEAVRIANGELIVIAAGDDVSLPHRAARMAAAWRGEGGRAAYLYSDVQPVDAKGELTSWPRNERIYTGAHSIDRMARGYLPVLGASAAFTRDLVINFAPMRARLRHEDRVLPFRAALLGGRTFYVDEPLIQYRLEGGVSRNLPVSKVDYLRRWTRDINARTIEDAHQRLEDAIAKDADHNIVNACRRAIALQRSMIELAQSYGFGVEGALLTGLNRGAAVRPLVAHYLKMRLPVGRRTF